MRTVLRRLALLWVVGLVCITATVAPPALAVPGDDPQLDVSTWMSGLFIPWDVAFLPDGSALVTQRDEATIELRRPDGTVERVDANLRDVDPEGEGGLMAIVADPDFDLNHRFYTCQIASSGVQVIAWRLDAARPSARRVANPLVGGIDRNATGRHSGCRLRFDFEGHLRIATGDAAHGTNPQDLSSLAGKTLRVDPVTGRGIDGNPFIGRRGDDRIFTYGHRNIQGLDRRPCTAQMWTAEHGPSRDDEINRLVAGGNYGWNPVPGYNEGVPMTDTRLPGPQQRARWSSGDRTVAISGAGWLRGAAWRAWDGQLAGATLKDSRLMVFGFSDRDRLTGISIPGALDLRFGRLRTPVQGPDGALYVTSDSVGSILRVAPVGASEPGGQDLDGDGSDDLLIGAPGAAVSGGTRAGAVAALYGDGSDLIDGRSRLRTQQHFEGSGARAGEMFGSAIAYGDIDGDGTTDVVIASPGERVGGRTSAGAVTVVCGRTDGLDRRSSQTFSQAGSVPGRPRSGEGFGTAVAMGDFDGDGHDDLAAGAPGERVEGSAGAGSVTILEGTSAGLRTDSAQVLDRSFLPGSPTTGEALGATLAVGDFDGDGRDDLAIGAPAGTAGAGSVVVVPGSRRGLAPEQARVIDLSSSTTDTGAPGDGFGSSLAGGDLDGDGTDDLAIGVPGDDQDGSTNTGSVVWIRGGADGLATAGSAIAQTGGDLEGPGTGDRFGAALVIADLDDDGTADLAVGIPGERVDGRSGAGRVAGFSGGAAGPDSPANWSLSQAGPVPGEPGTGDSFGASLRSANFDGDVLADLAVGIPGEAVSGLAGAGAVLVFSGTPIGPSPVDARLLTQSGRVPGEPAAGARFGAAL